LREQRLGKLLGADDHFPDLVDDSFEEVEVALLGGDHALPIPLIDVGGVVVIEEVVLADSAHIGADTFPDFAIELLQRNSLPLGRGLNNLRVDGMLVAVV
jgi:hypothetical protein